MIMPAVTEVNVEASEQPEADVPSLDFSSAENRDGELVFTVTGAALIEAFNAEYGEVFLPEMDAWQQTVCQTALNSPYETVWFRFQMVEGVTMSPAVYLYTPSDSDLLGEIVLVFDHHGYADWAYSLYARVSGQMLALLLPDMDAEAYVGLFETLYDLAIHDDACYLGTLLNGEITPPLLYWQDDVGLYPCYAGGLVYICAVPVTAEYMEALAARNIELIAIEQD